MLALLQNEMVLYAIIIALVGAVVIGKFIGFKKFFGYFYGSSERVATAKAKTAKAPATAAKPAE
jgi:hypothetical protein